MSPRHSLWVSSSLILALIGCGQTDTPPVAQRERPAPVNPDKRADPVAPVEKSSEPREDKSQPALETATRDGLAPVSLAPAGLYITLDLPPGVTAKPSFSGVLLEGTSGFRLNVSPDDGYSTEIIMDAAKKLVQEENIDIVSNSENKVVAGGKIFDEERYHAYVKVTAGEQLYLCVSERGDIDGLPHTKALVTLMAECAQTARQTNSDRVAMERAAAAEKRLKELGGRYSKPSGNVAYLETDFSDDDLILLKDLPHTESIHLSAEKLTGAGLAQLRELPFLRNATLEGEAAKDDWLAALPPKRIQWLFILATSISADGLRALQDQPQLEVLTIRDQPVADVSLANIAGLQHLEKLNLSDSGIGDEGLKHLQNLPQLTWLELTNTQITDEGLQHLEGLKSLNALMVGGTKVTKQGAEAFKKVMPQCDVDFE